MAEEKEIQEGAAGRQREEAPAAAVRERAPRKDSSAHVEEDEAGSGKGKGRRYSHLSERNRCRFTRAGVKRIDYKDVVTLHKLMTTQGKILSRKRTGIAARYQRMVKKAVKRARYMALLPYTGVKG